MDHHAPFRDRSRTVPWTTTHRSVTAH